MTDEERYCLGLMIEEMGESLQIFGKALRFGLDVPGPDVEPYNGKTARELLPKELGDVWAGMMFAGKHGLVSDIDLVNRAGEKLSKLMNPESVDSNGVRLAPAPPGKP